ncbi:MAG TPA: MFS transporter, partial [Polyangiales bacterium]|nr:MFS transporter [Polyangiales bacterium]
MNNPRTVISFVNAAHFLDHYAMLIFAAAVVVMAPIFGMTYSEFLPYATPGFVAFGAGSLLTGWLGDRWSRRHMLAIYFVGLGAALIATGFARTPQQLSLALFAIGAFGSIYHPVGTAMLVAYAAEVGREVGINGVWGNLGVASAALVTGILTQYFGWQSAFVVPGAIAIGLGLAFTRAVAHEKRVMSSSAAAVRVDPGAMKRVILALVVTIVASSTTFNAITVAIPKLFAERLTTLTHSTAWIGVIAAAVYVFGALAQYTIGHLLDRHSLKSVFLPMAFLLAPLLAAAAFSSGWLLILVSIGIVIGIFGQVTINDAMVAKYTSDQWRARAFAARYFLGFTAAGASVALVAWLHDRGGFELML